MAGTKQQVNKEDLEIQNEALENYFANTIIPQLFVDAEMILRKFTPPAMKQFSLSADDIGRHIKDVQEHIKHPTLIENITEVIRTGEILEREIQTEDNRWYQMNVLPYVERKKRFTNGVIITFVDITERLRTLKELEKLNNDHKTLMFALSHDIRQPLSTMILASEELADAFEAADRTSFRKWVETIQRTSTTLKDLVNDFTQHIRIWNDGPAEDGPVNISSTFEDVTLSLREEIQDHQVRIDTRFEVKEVIFQRSDLRSILYNLLNNAIKYRKTGVPLQITVSTEKEDRQIVFSVCDNGMGIAPEHQRSIFKERIRINHDTEGTGMGLYIISRMLERRGDRIEVQSTPGHGSTFKVYIAARE